ncbi:hypothetical protein FACS189460_4040 [Deltaproteobacteria bacterium]|nr:hypothetical protein FACS189460_4040 [Deltaproteobacteria bacterium]
MTSIISKLGQLISRRALLSERCRRNEETLAKIYDINGPLCLHLGSGGNLKPGWINVDGDQYLNKNLKVDLCWDLAKPLPLKPDSVDYAYSEHFIEHLTVAEGAAFFSNIYKILRPGGVLRTATPTLENVIKTYLSPAWVTQEELDIWGLSQVKTRCELTNLCFTAWGHHYLYDAEELSRRLKEAGFRDVILCEWNKSEHPVLNNIESHGPEYDSLIMEAVK